MQALRIFTNFGSLVINLENDARYQEKNYLIG